MTILIGSALIVVLIVWLAGGRGSRPAPAPEDDVQTPIDYRALEQAERELERDDEARPVDDEEGDKDWGPGTR